MDGAESRPNDSRMILNDFFVDDLLTELNFIIDLILLFQKITDILPLGVFHLENKFPIVIFSWRVSRSPFHALLSL